MTGGTPTQNDRGNGRYRDLQLEARIDRLDDRIANLTGSVEALRLEFMDHRGGIASQVEHVSGTVHDNTAALNKFCAVEAIKWENHADLHSRENTHLRTWSAITSAVFGTVAGVIGFFGGPTS